MFSFQQLRGVARVSVTAMIQTPLPPVFSRIIYPGGAGSIVVKKPNYYKPPQLRLLPHLQARSLSSSSSTFGYPGGGNGRGTRSVPALFVRGGTSNGLVVRRSDLPAREEDWAQVLPAAMGAPDGRQLDGMGGGASSTSKVCVLAPAGPELDADVEFTFVQVGVRDGALDLAGNCGNMAAAVGPAAWDEDILAEGARERILSTATAAAAEARGGGGEMMGKREGEEEKEEYREVTVRIFNTNTSKVIHSRFRVRAPNTADGDGDEDGELRYCPEGDYEMDGVPGTQSRITLSFLDPAGAAAAKTGGRAALPTGRAVDELALPDGTRVRASLVDVSNPGVFVRADEVLDGDVDWRALTPEAVESEDRVGGKLKARLEAIRRAGAAKMGLDPDTESVPKIVLLFPPTAAEVAGGSKAAAAAADVRCLALSMGQAHRAVPLTLALCLGAAANMPGTIAAEVRRRNAGVGGGQGQGQGQGKKGKSSVVIGHPSGLVEIGVTIEDGRIVSADLHRTARVLMRGEVYY
ncbi:methylitaconate delta2-delta3-isomerase [Biscogniauxia mediterranea]|nr:methylitaconate delta2-delta3-isomerase [Biscogniauxia mediterranea]